MTNSTSFPDLEEIVHALSVLFLGVTWKSPSPPSMFEVCFHQRAEGAWLLVAVLAEKSLLQHKPVSLSQSLSAGFRVPATSNTPPQQQLVSGTLTCAQPSAITTGIMLGFTITVNEKCQIVLVDSFCDEAINPTHLICWCCLATDVYGTPDSQKSYLESEVSRFINQKWPLFDQKYLL